MSLTLDSALAGEARRPLIHGSFKKPFPTLLNLDYPLCRAQAWLLALADAEKYLPAALLSRLHSADLDSSLGRLALSSLLTHIESVTPESAESGAIRVFLKWPDEPLSRGLALIGKSDILRMEMAFIWEMRQCAEEMLAIWPKSASQKPDDKLAELAEALDQLWQAVHFNNQQLDVKKGLWGTAFIHNKLSAALKLKSAEAIPASDAGNLNNALAAFIRRESANDADRNLWNYLAAKILILRGRIHSQRDSLALAEADLKAALSRLHKIDSERQLSAQAWLELAKIYRLRDDARRMCDALVTACANGECQGLSHARRQGECQPAAPLE